jgi:RNA polymerase sigma factor (TIGR02999 family)
MSRSHEVTRILLEADPGDRSALDRLLPLIYGELHDLAARYLQRERVGHTLQTTALVNEAYLKLVDQTRVRWENRAHFMAVAATAMRRILVNHARARGRLKRGGDRLRVSEEAPGVKAPDRPLDLVALDEALNRLAAMDPRQSRIVEMKFFAGLTVEEIAKQLEVSPRTVHREWVSAKAWLSAEVRKGDEDGS